MIGIYLIKALVASALVIAVPMVGKALGDSAASLLGVAPVLSAFLLLTNSGSAAGTDKAEQALWSALGAIPCGIFYVAFYFALKGRLSIPVALLIGVGAWFLAAALLRKLA
ncbi:MAG: hypothetical protein IJM30_11830 [Thermoguttaceae bacterium]|nr:hypothetical protein [Thermoguttaceae bacterium]